LPTLIDKAASKNVADSERERRFPPFGGDIKQHRIKISASADASANVLLHCSVARKWAKHFYKVQLTQFPSRSGHRVFCGGREGEGARCQEQINAFMQCFHFHPARGTIIILEQAVEELFWIKQWSF